MSRIRIVHRTGFSYDEPATASYNEARMLPHSGGEQFVLQAGLDIRPGATQHSYLDYWGTRVSTFEVLTPHRELSVTATSLVEVRPGPPLRSELGWDELALGVDLGDRPRRGVVAVTGDDPVARGGGARGRDRRGRGARRRHRSRDLPTPWARRWST